MLRKFLSTTITLLIYTIICHKIYLEFKIEKPKEELKQVLNKSNTIQETQTLSIKTTIEETPKIKYTPLPDTSIGTLKINKINLFNKIYPINDPLNNIEKNVTVLNYSNIAPLVFGNTGLLTLSLIL